MPAASHPATVYPVHRGARVAGPTATRSSCNRQKIAMTLSHRAIVAPIAAILATVALTGSALAAAPDREFARSPNRSSWLTCAPSHSS